MLSHFATLSSDLTYIPNANMNKLQTFLYRVGFFQNLTLSSAVGFHKYDFMLVFNNNICPNCSPF